MRKITLLLLLFSQFFFGQSLILDNAFDMGEGFTLYNEGSVAVQRPVLQPDGKIIVPGQYLNYNGISAINLVRLNPNGTRDADFNIGSSTNAGIWDCTLQPDGKIIIVGGFTLFNGVQRPRIARLNSNGTLDTGFNIITGPDDWIEKVLLQPDGKIIIVGSFTTFGSYSRNRIARLHTNGALDLNFMIGSGADGRIRDIAMQSDGKLIVAGDFNNFDGNASKKIARLNIDGSFDISFNVGVGPLGNIWAIALQTDQKVIIGGEFLTVNGNESRRLARLNPDGTYDNTFSVGTGLNSTAMSLFILPDGKIIVGGAFSMYQNVPRSRLARINANGILDANFTIGSGFDNWVTHIVSQPDGKLLMSGLYTSFNGAESMRLSRLVDNTLGMTELDHNKSFYVYPNPVSSILNLELRDATNIDVVEIYDLSGKSVLKQEVIFNQLNVDSLAKGVYLLVGQAGEVKFQTRFIKK